MTAQMEKLVDTVIEDQRWEAFGLDDLAERAAQAVLAELGLAASGFAICVMGCDDGRIAELNADFRGKPQPTNVLSWPSEERGAESPGARPDMPVPGTPDDPEELGDLALAYDTCLREAAEQGKSAQDHVTHLVAHGVLHLLGYDHLTDEDAELMEGIEISALDRLGVNNPY
jgi:probable rRNA maturation factor